MKIKLYNRDGADLYLENVHDDYWKLSIDDNHKYILEYMRVGYDSSNNITFIDPSGGPFISVGDKFGDNYTVEKIVDCNNIIISKHEGNNHK